MCDGRGNAVDYRMPRILREFFADRQHLVRPMTAALVAESGQGTMLRIAFLAGIECGMLLLDFMAAVQHEG